MAPERTNERTNERTMAGQVLIRRRQQGLCVDCGYGEPHFNRETGARELLCPACIARSETAETEARLRLKEARAREDAKQGTFEECV